MRDIWGQVPSIIVTFSDRNCPKSNFLPQKAASIQKLTFSPSNSNSSSHKLIFFCLKIQLSFPEKQLSLRKLTSFFRQPAFLPQKATFTLKNQLSLPKMNTSSPKRQPSSLKLGFFFPQKTASFSSKNSLSPLKMFFFPKINKLSFPKLIIFLLKTTLFPPQKITFPP